MFCGNCGKNFDEDNIFCPYCGSKVELLKVDVIEPQTSVNEDILFASNNGVHTEKKEGKTTTVVVVSVIAALCLIIGLVAVSIKTGGTGSLQNLFTSEEAADDISVDDEEFGFYEENDSENYTTDDQDSYYVYGDSYRVLTNLRVREGPGKQYRILERDELLYEDYEKSVDSDETNDALIEKGNIITCLGMDGDWMNIASGWVCVYDEGEVLVR